MTTAFRNTVYRTSDGLEDYVFDFIALDDGWRIYIVRQPSYGGRDESLHVTHRLIDGDRYYVCWDSPLRRLNDAKAVAALWADATQSYRRRGRFEAGADRSHVYDRSSSAHVNPSAADREAAGPRPARGGNNVDDADPDAGRMPAPRPWYAHLIRR